MAFDSKIERVQVTKIDLDLECMYDLATEKGIRLQSVESFDKKNAKMPYGLQSEFFGSDFGDEESFRERYSCKCKKYIGKVHAGKLCEKCGTVVEYNDIDLTKTGWIILDHFKVMSPIFAVKLRDALGTFEGDKVLDKIIEMDYFDEGESPELTEREQGALVKHPFIKKGMRWLCDHLEEVIDYYAAIKKTKAKLFQELRDEYSLIWVHSIPVYSALLRTELPGEKGSKSFKLKINTTYQSIIKLANAINHVEVEEFDHKTLNAIDIQLAAIQREIFVLFDITYKDLTTKTGILVSKVLGGRYNFSTRNIIVPATGWLRSDEVELGYIPFMELFRYEIINFYSKIQGCSIQIASTAWKKATNHFDPTMYAIMTHIVTDKECSKYANVLINRNPSINYGSFIFMRVVGVKEDFTAKTLTLPTHDIVPMNADFDGDCINVFRIIGEDFAKRFAKNLNPRYNLFVSRMDGRTSRDMLPMKDEAVAFWGFNNL